MFRFYDTHLLCTRRLPEIHSHSAVQLSTENESPSHPPCRSPPGLWSAYGFAPSPSSLVSTILPLRHAFTIVPSITPRSNHTPDHNARSLTQSQRSCVVVRCVVSQWSHTSYLPSQLLETRSDSSVDDPPQQNPDQHLERRVGPCRRVPFRHNHLSL